MPEGTLLYLDAQAKFKEAKKVASQKVERKRLRNKKVFDKIKLYAEEAVMARRNAEVYKSGIAMAGDKPAKIQANKRRCGYCHSVGHNVRSCPNKKQGRAQRKSRSLSLKWKLDFSIPTDASTDIVRTVRENERLDEECGF